MTRPRKEQVSVDDTPYYHIVSRCVRRSFLCGVDHSTGKSYEHRRQWIENRIRLVSSLFGVEIIAYAVMSNHLHIVLKLCPDSISCLSNEEIVERWTSLFKGPLLVQKWQDCKTLDTAELQAVNDSIAVYRRRLANLGWFMKSINEPIARQANKEDGCSGHFWEARYKSQALRTEEALLSCMTYVDLNPIRAGMAKTPEASNHTSIKERIRPQFNLADAIEEQINLGALNKFDVPLKPLAHFESAINENAQSGILFSFKDYLELVDYTGRCIREDKRGSIPNYLPPILQRLHIDFDTWIENTTEFGTNYQKRFSKKSKHRCCSG